MVQIPSELFGVDLRVRIHLWTRVGMKWVIGTLVLQHSITETV